MVTKLFEFMSSGSEVLVGVCVCVFFLSGGEGKRVGSFQKEAGGCAGRIGAYGYGSKTCTKMAYPGGGGGTKRLFLKRLRKR